MELNIIHNEDCRKTMLEHIDEHSVDMVLTSPPYCTSNRAGKKSTATLTNTYTSGYPSYRYDVFLDNMTPDEYIEWNVNLFNDFDRILKENGCVLYNISYSSDNRDTMFIVISEIIRRTNFSLADWIGWKKHTALPNNTSPNKLTRIFEPVFVFARKCEIDSFVCNKKVVSVRERTGQKMYENVFNFIDAANNDGSCKLNKATYSSELCEKLLGIYGKSGMTVYDPFMGTGTTGVACKRFGINYIGSEISAAQIDFANNRISSDCGIRTNFEEIVEKKQKRRDRKIKQDNENPIYKVPKGYIQPLLFDVDSENETKIESDIKKAEIKTVEDNVIEVSTQHNVESDDSSFETMFSSSVGFSSVVNQTDVAINNIEWESI